MFQCLHASCPRVSPYRSLDSSGSYVSKALSMSRVQVPEKLRRVILMLMML
jgi:hypothetical protein